MSVEILLNKVKSENPQDQYEAWLWADDVGPDALPALGELYSTDDPRLVRAAETAMDRIVHSVGTSKDHPRRKAVQAALHEYMKSESTDLKVYALRSISQVGDDDSIPVAVKELSNPDLREEAVFCLERIPGAASEAALLQALPAAEDAFKPRVIYALGHRKVKNAVDAIASFTDSKDNEIAIRALEALANMGMMPASLKLSAERFEGRHRTMFFDSLLRLADAQAAQGSTEKAIEIYTDILGWDEESIGEHFHCAAIVGLGKIKNDAARKAIENAKGKAVSYIVKNTADKALAG